MIYCVIPRELEADLYDKMVDYYADNPDVEVIVDRRDSPDRRKGEDLAEETRNQRITRDRRRAHPGRFPNTDVPDDTDASK